MSNFCNHCGLCCKLIPACNGNIIRDGFQPVEDFFNPIELSAAININEDYVNKVQNIFPQAIFYTCKYLQNNRCSKQNMPEYCKNFPNSALALIPDECGYNGEIFLKSEALKQKIRKLKEEIIHYEAQILSNPKEKNSYQKIINSHKNYIKKYEPFGAQNW
ncbi:MAG: hypothetical protein NC408_07710 [Candidatus Gastranaerophilales bacterium]|nr:hypothetical protein [Candidatus Gastranaerophilales bacterium]MCM1072495.1 hypothetical protein [Bacteroides sp.]